MTVIFYHTVVGGVPAEKDVIAAVDDLEAMFAATAGKGRLGDDEFDFMKSEL